jgi:Tol biopolymer transport system component
VSSFDLHPDLAARLDRFVPADELTGDWGDVVRRVRRAPRRRALKVAVAVAAFFVVAAVATATYIALTRSSAARPQAGALTVVSDSGNGPAQIVEVLENGVTRVVWHCPQNVFCGDLVGVDWAPDGRHVAFTLDQIGGMSAYVGLHILDITSGRDIHIPHLRLADPMAPQPPSVFPGLIRQMEERLGCRYPRNVAWSPDGKRLAYDCLAGDHRQVFTIRSDGTGHRLVRTWLAEASAPAWSPAGHRLAFAGGARQHGPSAIYVMAVDGSHRVRVASGTAPDWSSDGRTIAYRTTKGVRLVTTDGTDATAGGAPIAPRGMPAWSPDGQRLAIGTRSGVYLVEKTGRHLQRATTRGTGILGEVRPAWYPATSMRRAAADCGGC